MLASWRNAAPAGAVVLEAGGSFQWACGSREEVSPPMIKAELEYGAGSLRYAGALAGGHVLCVPVLCVSLVNLQRMTT